MSDLHERMNSVDDRSQQPQQVFNLTADNTQAQNQSTTNLTGALIEAFREAAPLIVQEIVKQNKK
ncbi:MAG: hypothetical protein OXI96_08845 [Acidimicrobiaceae bacterium]|nr:hypothetical protein [Acidimicrobiaceae bacterium]